MQKNNFKIREVLSSELGYSEPMIKKLICGTNKPSYEVMLKLSKEHGIPFEAWQDIRAWLGLPPTRTQLKLREQSEASLKTKFL